MKKFNLLKGLAMSLLTLALCFVAFGAAKAHAGITATYEPDTDTIKVSGGSGSTLYFLDLKKSGKQKIKNASDTSLSGGEATIKLDDKNDGLKIGENKTIYFYATDVDPDSLEKAEGTAILTVKGSTVKKLTVTLNYALSVSGEDTPAFTAAIDKKTIEGTPQEVAAKIIFCSSTDGKTFDEWKPGTELTGDVLYKAVTGDDAVTFLFKLKGDANTRASKPAKVKVAKAAKAVKTKVDFLKGVLSIKNGFDYIVSSSSAEPTGEWMTILPYNKAGTASGSGAIVATSDFTPYAKAEDATSKASFTKDKIKSVDLSTLFEGAGEIYLYTRKSATAKKPASLPSEDVVVVKAPEEAPSFTSVSGETDTKKKKTTFVSDLSDCEYLIVKTAGIPEDLSEAKWVKLGSKGIELNKSKTKVSKKENNVLKDSSYILIRKAGVKNESLPSDITITKIKKESGASGETIYVWEENE